MNPRTLAPVVLLLIAAPLQCQSISSPPASSSRQGAAILQQSLNAAGLAAGVPAAFTANGTIQYFWAGRPVEADATVRARGGGQFRIDARLPDGVRSVSTTPQGGGRKNPNGRLDVIPAHNTLDAMIPTFPYLSIAAALGDASTEISYAGLVDEGGRSLHQVRIARTFPKEADPDGLLKQFSTVDYFVDSQTLLLVKADDLVHPKESAGESYRREMRFESYASFGGVSVPTVVREQIAGQTTWEFHLANIAFNSNLTDADFSLE